MASIHVQNLEVFPFHEPLTATLAPGFGGEGGLRSRPSGNADRVRGRSHRFMASIHVQRQVETFHEPPRSGPLRRPAGERVV